MQNNIQNLRIYRDYTDDHQISSHTLVEILKLNPQIKQLLGKYWGPAEKNEVEMYLAEMGRKVDLLLSESYVYIYQMIL